MTTPETSDDSVTRQRRRFLTLEEYEQQAIDYTKQQLEQQADRLAKMHLHDSRQHKKDTRTSFLLSFLLVLAVAGLFYFLFPHQDDPISMIKRGDCFWLNGTMTDQTLKRVDHYTNNLLHAACESPSDSCLVPFLSFRQESLSELLNSQNILGDFPLETCARYSLPRALLLLEHAKRNQIILKKTPSLDWLLDSWENYCSQPSAVSLAQWEDLIVQYFDDALSHSFCEPSHFTSLLWIISETPNQSFTILLLEKFLKNCRSINWKSHRQKRDTKERDGWLIHLLNSESPHINSVLDLLLAFRDSSLAGDSGCHTEVSYFHHINRREIAQWVVESLRCPLVVGSNDVRILKLEQLQYWMELKRVGLHTAKFSDSLSALIETVFYLIQAEQTWEPSATQQSSLEAIFHTFGVHFDRFLLIQLLSYAETSFFFPRMHPLIIPTLHSELFQEMPKASLVKGRDSGSSETAVWIWLPTSLDFLGERTRHVIRALHVFLQFNVESLKAQTLVVLISHHEICPCQNYGDSCQRSLVDVEKSDQLEEQDIDLSFRNTRTFISVCFPEEQSSRSNAPRIQLFAQTAT